MNADSVSVGSWSLAQVDLEALVFLLPPLPQGFPELCAEGFDGDITFRSACYNFSHSALCLAMNLHICSYILQKKISQVMVAQGTVL